MVAYRLVADQKYRYLAQKFSEPWWRQVLIFYSGIAGDVTHLMNDIQQIHGITDYRGTIREMIAEARHTPGRLRALVKDLLNEYSDDEFVANDDLQQVPKPRSTRKRLRKQE